ncbi:MAG: tRNA nucleotidyltransferase, partial [Bacteroidales bacterium]
MIDKDFIYKNIDKPVFRRLSDVADTIGVPCFVVGGYVRDMILERLSKDIDVVVVGSGIDVASQYATSLGRGAVLSVFKNFGTAQVKYKGIEVEFVGARKESYTYDSRKPIVENGTLEDDQKRRDFTINDIAVCLNADMFGELIDPFDGIADIAEGIIRTPLDPDITFSDDPLRMMRAIRFATQLQFTIEKETLAAIERNRERIKIISAER